MSVKALYLNNYCAMPISASASCTYEGLNCLPSILACCVLFITFSGYAIFRLCLSQVIAFSGYCIFRLEHFPVLPSSGSAKKQGYCIFRYAIFSHPFGTTTWQRISRVGTQKYSFLMSLILSPAETLVAADRSSTVSLSTRS
jgi:hypothetical protein